jgi:hypothetical protein
MSDPNAVTPNTPQPPWYRRGFCVVCGIVILLFTFVLGFSFGYQVGYSQHHPGYSNSRYDNRPTRNRMEHRRVHPQQAPNPNHTTDVPSPAIS